METFSSLLQGVAPRYLSTPVVDATGIKGSWDFDLKWMASSALYSAAGTGHATVFEAVDKQLGLKLEERQVASSVLVVDSVRQKPTDSPADVGVRLPALPSEFIRSGFHAGSPKGHVTFTSGPMNACSLSMRLRDPPKIDLERSVKFLVIA